MTADFKERIVRTGFKSDYFTTKIGAEITEEDLLLKEIGAKEIVTSYSIEKIGAKVLFCTYFLLRT